MVGEAVLISRLGKRQLRVPASTLATCLRYSSTTPQKPTLGPTTPYAHSKPPPPPQTWLASQLKQNPTALKVFLGFTRLLGYGSKKQVAGRRAYLMYERLCAVRPDEEREFWQGECHLPPTFQSWFTVTNLHVWLLTARLRALPKAEAQNHIQALIDHFFLDVEERVRAVLQPASPKSTPEAAASSSSSEDPSPSTFYTVANSGPNKTRPKGKAPERLVTRQMKILKEQWAGLGMSLDLALIKGDAEMAGAVWRNFLGGRGARGIVYPSSLSGDGAQTYFRRSVNLVGGKVESVANIDAKGLEAEEARDDGSGVHDYAPAEAGKYVKYPELMEDMVSYIRRELTRLEGLSDADLTGPGVMGREGDGLEKLRFGKVRLGSS